MQLQFIALDRLSVSKANMRHGKTPPDVSDILPTIRKRGVIQSLLVRPGPEPEHFQIDAGSRRFHAAGLDAAEKEIAPGDYLLPCGILEEGDDAAAIEASLIENMARLDPDEVRQWEAFTRLAKQGQTPEAIGLTFGLPELAVRRTLALGNLLPRLRDLYRRDKIDRVTIRHLTLASKAQQRDWLALFDDPEKRAPSGNQIKAWLFGGSTIPTAHALFPLDGYAGTVVADLFGEGGYFADAEAFWAAQSDAIAARCNAFMEAGWVEVIVLPRDTHFQRWEYDKTPKRKGGRVYVEVRANGEVVFHEGFFNRREAEKRAKGEAAAPVKVARPEIASGMRAYIDLHRHAAVRAAMLAKPGVALRMMAAHVIGTGAAQYSVKPDGRSAPNDAVAESAECARAETVFDEKRRAALAVLGFGEDEAHLVHGYGVGHEVTAVFERLLELPDSVVMELVAVAMGETLARGSAEVEALGSHLGLDMADWWEADTAFFDLIRDKEVLGQILREVAGGTVAIANAKEKAKTSKAIVVAHLEGTDGRPKVERWVPLWMAFPPAAYTARGGVGTVKAHARWIGARPVLPEPETQGSEQKLAA
ncbi:MAG: ParB N-terminal domain-containing protein [Sphingomonas sp.]